MCFNIFSRVKALETKVADLCDRLDRAQVGECKCDHTKEFEHIAQCFDVVMNDLERLKTEVIEVTDHCSEIYDQLEDLPTKSKDLFYQKWDWVIELLRNPDNAKIFCEALDIPVEKVFHFSDALEKFKEKVK